MVFILLFLIISAIEFNNYFYLFILKKQKLDSSSALVQKKKQVNKSCDLFVCCWCVQGGKLIKVKAGGLTYKKNGKAPQSHLVRQGDTREHQNPHTCVSLVTSHRHMWSRTWMPITKHLLSIFYTSWTQKKVFLLKKISIHFVPFLFFLSHSTQLKVFEACSCSLLLACYSCHLPHNPTFKVACS